jgi:hypothetical protein
MQDNGACAENMRREADDRRAEKPALPPLPKDHIFVDVRPKQTREGWPVIGGRGVMPGPADTFLSYGEAWANVSNTPFRKYKHWVHEGGISTPLIAHWPEGIGAHGELRAQPAHLIDIMSTCLDVAGAPYPAERGGQRLLPPEGRGLRGAFAGEKIDREALYWEHEGNRAVRVGDWKLVADGPAGPWELYDIRTDRSETRDLSAAQPDRVRDMSALWEAWARRANVIPWPWKPAYGEEPTAKAAPGPAVFNLKPDEKLSGSEAPQLGGRGFTATVEIKEVKPDGVLIAQGGSAQGFSMFLRDGVPAFATRVGGTLTTAQAKEPLAGAATLAATLEPTGAMSLSRDGTVIASAMARGPLRRQPDDGLQVGRDEGGAVGDYPPPFPFAGRLGSVTVQVK